MKKSPVMKNSLLSQRALLAVLTVKIPPFRLVDKTANATVEKTHKTSSEAGNYTKRLLPGSSELSEVTACVTRMRKFCYEKTLPWLSDGSRILNAKYHQEFTKEFSKLKTDFESAVKDFCKAYPALQAAAKQQLGSLYDSSEYPAPSEIREKFHAEMDFLPLPDVKDFRVDISDAQKRDFVEKMKQTEAAAAKSAAERIHAVVKTAAEKLGKPDAIFRDSLLENIGEMVALLPMLNISGDAELERARRELDKFVKGNSADKIRADDTVRADAAKTLRAVEDKMGAFMGRK